MSADEQPQPEITAYAQAGLQPCDACGKPGWSIDGTVVIRHEVDADEDVCPGVLARKEALDRAIEQLIGVYEPPTLPTPKPVTCADLVALFDKVSATPYRPSYPPPKWYRVEVDKTLDAEDLMRDEYQTIMDRYVAELVEQHTAKLGALAAEAAKSGCTLCVHEGRSMTTDTFDLAKDSVKLTMRVRYHVIRPGQVCMVVPRTQYGAPVEPGGPPA